MLVLTGSNSQTASASTLRCRIEGAQAASMALEEYEDGGVAKTIIGPPTPLWFTWLTRASEITTFLLVSVWVLKDLGGLAFTAVSTGENSTDTSGIFNWHPLLMSLAFPVLMAEAVLAYRAPLSPALERYCGLAF